MTEQLSVSHVKPAQAAAVWDYMLPTIQSAVRRGQGDSETDYSMLARVLEGKSQMWAVHDDDVRAIVVVSVNDYPGARKVFVDLLAGSDIDEWASLVDDKLMQLKELTHADCVESSCRRGLAKYLKAMGWKEKAVVMGKV